MKKVLFIIAFTVFSATLCAQSLIGPIPTVVHENSILNICNDGRQDCDVNVSGHINPIYSYRSGYVPYVNFRQTSIGCSIYGITDFDYDLNIGVKGETSSGTTGRGYGVWGMSKATNPGYCYGVFGQLGNIRTNTSGFGTGVYGTSVASDNGVYIDGRYAGYFNGSVRVTDSLKVRILRANTTLGAAASGNGVNGESVEEYMPKSNVLPSLGELGTYTFATSKDSPETRAAEQEEELKENRLHYGLSADQVARSFPELVYKTEEGHEYINYMELIPILIKAINELQLEVEKLKSTSSLYVDSGDFLYKKESIDKADDFQLSDDVQARFSCLQR